MNNRKGLQLKWLVQMAWRDSRRNRSRLFLFVSSILLGIAALVAIYSLSDNLDDEIDKQAASLIGADLQIGGNRPPGEEILKLVDSLGDRKSVEQSFASMIYFTKTEDVRLVQVKAIEGEFPYYGSLDTEPVSAAQSFRTNQQALVDQTLMVQFNAKVGDTINLGNLSFTIAGSLLKAPGQTGFSASVSPAVYIPLQYLEGTGLSQKGSRISHRYFFKYDRPVDMKKLIERIEPRLDEDGYSYDTIETKKEDSSRAFSDLTRFLSLVGFIALLLGCIGVASAIHIYIKEKIKTIAVLRCLGLTAMQAFLIFLIQILTIGLIGSVAGAMLGTIVQQFLPAVLEDFLPFSVPATISWSSIAQGIALGIVITILFALLPLMSIRKISPLLTLRLSVQEPEKTKDRWSWLVYALILSFIFGFTFLQMNNWKEATFFTLGILIAFFILTAIAKLLMWFVRKFFPQSWNYLWRQGLANLFRPNNQTAILLVSIGLGTAFICTLFFIQGLLINRISLSSSGNQPNMLLFDIQSEQKQDVMKLTESQGLPVTAMVPIVNMRLDAVNSINALKLQQDSTLPMQRWLFTREYRVTFRDSLTDSERIVEGKWRGNRTSTEIPISIEQRFADRNEIKLGDTMFFNVQGAVLPTVVRSFRKVDWNRVQSNFLVVFPVGVLEQAPQFHILLTKVPDTEVSARFQQAVVRQFPNVSIIDLGLVLDVLDEILSKVGFVIQFMAGFSIFTGLIVLIASVLISKYQRMEESVLLRTLGASRRQIFVITALEYFFLGAFAAATGIIMSLIASWLLAYYSFETSFTPELLPVLIIFIIVCLLTVVIGLINSRAVVNKPPLEILRQEV
jgi:putative ABC transport system permease protein